MEKTLWESKDFLSLRRGFVEWCEHDLAGDNFAGAGPEKVAEELAKCIIFTCAMDMELNDILKRLIFKYQHAHEKAVTEEE